MRRALAVFALVVAVNSFAEAWDIAPPPRGQWLLDESGKLSASTVAQVNALAGALDVSGAGQLGVLVTTTTRGHNPRDFATGVFNSWGVGHQGSNDGVLLFVAVDDRKAEIILGDGSRVATSQTDVVMRDDVVAHMKQKDLDGAVLSAAKSLDRLMRRAVGKAPTPHPGDNSGLGPDSYTTPITDTPQVDDALDAYARGETHFPERSPRTWVVDLSDVLTASQRAQLDVAASDIYATGKGRIFFLVYKSTLPYPSIDALSRRLVSQVAALSAAHFSVITYDVGTASARIWLPEDVVPGEWEQQQRDLAVYELQSAAVGDPVAGLVAAQQFAQQALVQGVPPKPMSTVLAQGFDEHSGKVSIAGGGFLLGLLMWVRRWFRNRPRSCAQCNVPMQRLDEQADDAHLTDKQLTEERLKSVDYDVWHCGRCDGVLVLDYSRWFSGYSSCTSCSTKAMSSTSTTLRHATEYSTGEVRVDQHCKHCNYRNSYTRTTPRITRSSSSSSSSSSRSSSFGGGSSSGRGSSGSW